MSRARDRIQDAAELYLAWWKSLPDARPTRLRRTVAGPFGPMLVCYCVNCGRPGGLATEKAEGIEHVFYLCPACVTTHGHLPLPHIPEGD